MKQLVSFVLLASSMLLMSCGSSQEVISFWRNPKFAQGPKFKSVIIVAVAPDLDARNIIETDLANAAQANGVTAVRSIDVYGGGLTKDQVPLMIQKIKESKCDAVLTASMLDEKSSQRYHSEAGTYAGGAAYAPYASYTYYGSFSTYVAFIGPALSTPGYYAEKKTYFIEGNLYDGASDEIVWSMQSKAYAPSDLVDFSRGYARLVADQLKKVPRPGQSTPEQH